MTVREKLRSKYLGGNRWRNWGRLPPFALAVIGLPYLGWRLFAGLMSEELPNCLTDRHMLPAPEFVVVGLICFVGGRYLGFFRFLDEWKGHQDAKSAVWAVGLFALFSLVLTLTFVFEAYGLAQVQGLEPITSYVRCAVVSDKLRNAPGIWTGVVVGAICFLVGHWLLAWHPTQSHRRNSP